MEEIKMDEDNPDYLVHEIFTQNFSESARPSAVPILGTVKTVSAFNLRQVVLDYYAGRFIPRNMVFSAAGHLQSRHLRRPGCRTLRRPRQPAAARSLHPRPRTRQRQPAHYAQAQEVPGAGSALPSASPPRRSDSPTRYAVYLLEHHARRRHEFSRLPSRTIREDRGLAYSIYSETNPFRDAGCLAIYAGTSAEKTPEVLRLTIRTNCAVSKKRRSDP